MANGQYDETNRGVFFLNDDKKTEKSPDYSGKINVRGEEFKISGWKKTSGSGKRFISISVTPAEAQAEGRNGGGFRQADDDGW